MRDQPEPPDGDKRVHTYFVVRQRYKRARWMAATAGILVAVLASKDFTPGTVALIASWAAAAWLLVEALWHWTRRRRFRRWY